MPCARRPRIPSSTGPCRWCWGTAAPLEAPENTIPSFLRALERGADGVELDVRLTRDGVPVVIHDATLDRTTDGRGPVAAQTLRQLRLRDAGAWFHPAFAGARIPTLDEVLAALPADAVLNVELKARGWATTAWPRRWWP